MVELLDTPENFVSSYQNLHYLLRLVLPLYITKGANIAKNISMDLFFFRYRTQPLGCGALWSDRVQLGPVFNANKN